MSELRYDPERLAPLRASAVSAHRHLLAARSADPAAASALRVTALVRSNLEQQWLPAIDRVLASDAMLAWTTAGPPWTRGLSGRELGLALAERADELCTDSRPHLVAELTGALRLAADDEAAMAAFFEALAPAVLLELVTDLATVDPGSIELPVVLRTGLAATAARGRLPDRYGRDLVRAAVDQHDRLGRTGDAGLALSFLVHGEDLPVDVVLTAVDELVAQERAFAERAGLDPTGGWTLWMVDGWAEALGLRLDFGAPLDGELDWFVARDPMYALLGQLARDGAAGREVFTDPDRARYLFGQRNVLDDGGRAIVSAAAEAAAGRDVVPGAAGQLFGDASLVASAFVNVFGRSNARAVRRDDVAAAAAARIIGTHLYGVDHALAWANGPTGDDRARSLPEADRDRLAADGSLTPDGRIVAEAGAAAVELTHQVLGGTRMSAVFDAAALGQVLDLAARADAGVAVLRQELATYQRGLAAAAAARIASGDVAASRTGPYLAEAMQDAARLEGHLVHHVGHEAERRGRDRDRVLSFWIGAIGNGAERAGAVLGPGGSAIADAVIEPATDLARDQFADAVERAQHDGEALAALAAEQLAYVWLRELHAAGLLDAALPSNVLDAGELPSYPDLAVILLTDGPNDPSNGWTVGTVLQELDDASGGSVDVDGRAMVDAMTAAQQDQYRTLAG